MMIKHKQGHRFRGGEERVRKHVHDWLCASAPQEKERARREAEEKERQEAERREREKAAAAAGGKGAKKGGGARRCGELGRTRGRVWRHV